MRLKSITIKTYYRDKGWSWGFGWPLCYGELPHIGWVVFERKTGKVIELFVNEFNQHGYNFAESKAKLASAPPHDPAINILHDLEA